MNEGRSREWMTPEQMLEMEEHLSPEARAELDEQRKVTVFRAAESDPDAAQWLIERPIFDSLPVEHQERLRRVAKLRRN